MLDSTFRSFRSMPRWSGVSGDGPRAEADAEWIDALPGLVAARCRRHGLTIDGPARHGSNALVVPVRRRGMPLVLRLAPPHDAIADEVRALRFWAGRGTVLLVDAYVAAGVTLLERLDATRSLDTVPLADAVPVIARLIRRLAVPAPADVRSTAELVGDRTPEIAAASERLAGLVGHRALRAALEAGELLSSTTSDDAVNGDLHFAQVLAGAREPWLVVDPVLLRGDAEYDLARVLWTRLDEMASDEEIRHWFDVVVREAHLDADRARVWVVWRAVDYALWGTDHGLTEDPLRCRRLAAAFVGPGD